VRHTLLLESLFWLRTLDCYNNHLPLGTGLIPFTTEEELIAAIDDLDARYDEHCLAARGLAEEYFCAEKVVSKLLAQADLV
jgi:hypothetical protein